MIYEIDPMAKPKIRTIILVGILALPMATVATASVLRPTGEAEKEVACIATDNVFQTLALILADVHLIRIKDVQIYTNDKTLLEFLTPPIKVKPTVISKVKPLFRPQFPLLDVPTGGDPFQWNILYNLLFFNRWQIKFAAKLPNTEVIYAEYIQSANRASLSGGARRLDTGVWTAP